MDNIKLSLDSIEMDCSLAETYFKKHKNVFYGVINGSPLNSNNSNSKDNFGNIIHTASNENIENIKSEWCTLRNGNNLRKIASAIKNHSKLISQIEYSVRKILPVQTEKYLKNILDYLEYCANCTFLLKNNENFKNFCGSKQILYFNDDDPLWQLLYKIIISLSLGMDVVLFTSLNSTALSVLLYELLSESGIPKNTFNVIPAENAYFQNLKNSEANKNEQGTLFIVFENSDLDSAVDCLVRILYPFDYCSPLYLKQVFVQESVIKIFEEKLKDKILKIETVYPKDFKPVSAMQKTLANLENVLKYSVDNNMKHFTMNKNFYGADPRHAFKPFILNDTCLADNLWENEVDKNFHLPVGMQAFRTTKEALNLIRKNTAYGLSLWCDNCSVADETALLANVDYVWLNSFGKMCGPVGWIIDDGYPNFANALQAKFGYSDFDEIKPINSQDYQALVDKSLKLQEKWKTFSASEKVCAFSTAVEYLELQKDYLISKQSLEKDQNTNIDNKASVEKAISSLYNFAKTCNNITNNLNLIGQNEMYMQVAKPYGVVGISGDIKYAEDIIQSVAAPLIIGNSIILSTGSTFVIEFCKILANSGLPVSTFKCDILMHPMKHDAVSFFLYICNDTIEPSIKFLSNCRRMLKCNHSLMKDMVDSRDLLRAMFSQQKLIWKTYGESFAL